VKKLDTLGPKERAVIEERLRTGYVRDELKRYGGEPEPHLRALIDRLLPGIPAGIDLVAFVDTHAANTLGRGDRSPGLPPLPELLRLGLQALGRRGFATLPVEDQDHLISRMRHGNADEELGVPAKEFVDRLLALALAGYLAHPETWERIGFNGPAYPEGYAWIDTAATLRRHQGFPGAARL
jgi:hypothetical protein